MGKTKYSPDPKTEGAVIRLPLFAFQEAIMADRVKYVDGIPVGLTDQDGTDARFSVDVNVTSGSISSSGITQYTEGDIDASITGTAVMWEDAANTLRSVSAAKPMPVSMSSDIQIGAVEIKDHDSAARLDVEAVTAKNALFDQSEDGAHVTTGAIADPIVAAGAVGTISAKLRRLTSDTGAILTAMGTANDTIYPEDSPHGTEDEGTFVLAVRNDSGSAMAGDGDYSVFMVDSSGRLYVNAEALDKDDDEVLIWANTVKDGSGTDYVPLVDSDGHLQVDVLTSIISSGSVDVLSLPSDTFVAEGGALGKGVLAQGDDGTDRHNLQTDPSGYLKTIAQATEAHIGRVATPSKQIQVTPTITAGAYSIGDVIGGVQTLTAAARVNATCTTLDTLAIRDKAMQDADIKLWFFDQNPTSGSYDDNDALDIDDADLAFCLGCLRMLSSDYDDATDNSIATLRNQGLKLTPTGGASDLYAIAEIETADSYASTSDLTFVYEFSQD